MTLRNDGPGSGHFEWQAPPGDRDRPRGVWHRTSEAPSSLRLRSTGDGDWPWAEAFDCMRSIDVTLGDWSRIAAPMARDTRGPANGFPGTSQPGPSRRRSTSIGRGKMTRGSL